MNMRDHAFSQTLTSASCRDYIAPALETNSAGRRNPSEAAIRPQALAFDGFFIVCAHQWRAGRSSRKAGRRFTGIPTSVRSATLRRKRVGGIKTATGAHTMKTPSHLSICMHHSAVKLAVKSDISQKDMLEQASLWLAQSREIFRMIANNCEESIGDEFFGAITLLELAKGLLDNSEFGGLDV